MQSVIDPITSAPHRTRSRRRRTLGGAVLVVTALALTGCYANPDPRDWGPAAKADFVAGCTEKVTASNGRKSTTTIQQIESKDVCGCIYDKMVNKYRLPWDEMKSYEDLQAGAKPAQDPPKPPEQLTKAIADCRPQGPGA